MYDSFIFPFRPESQEKSPNFEASLQLLTQILQESDVSLDFFAFLYKVPSSFSHKITAV